GAGSRGRSIRRRDSGIWTRHSERRGANRPDPAGQPRVRLARAAGVSERAGASRRFAPRGRVGRRIRGAGAPRNRRSGSGHSDRDRQLQTLRPHHPGDLQGRPAGGTGDAARRVDRGGRARASQPADAARRETKIRAFRHRYIRGKRRHPAADPGRLRSITENCIMRALRLFALATVLVTVYIIGRYNVGHLLPNSDPRGVWTEPAAAASGYSADEQNNIDIYRGAREATVNITSQVYRQNWFFQVYPEKGTGSGFIINSDGEILTNY